MSLPEAAKVDIAPRTVGIATDTIPLCGTSAAPRSISTISASPRARCISPSAVRRSRAAVLKNIDLDAVRAAPGVVAVLTAADIPGRNDVESGGRR